ncbi:peroxisomal membrane protein 4 [Microstroma glucosiphilum]|uniref:Peroxisomal membrane protein 4 n=1 Tax=Pseudomicrostroma glucosiphilum TaxID=1684307 RepID=A0A316UAB6_9BASI|nr:peroxisomal membrane protein 4 [Pseudomicrostroma glucosiphilum]PWN21411.1 peroxisomal membrane protein 4 [Pseudomicrostroma glucosiphilum]
MQDLRESLTRIALNPAYHDVLTVAKAARNGAVYGAKIRFPHALVMTFLFGRGTPREKFKFILTATRNHSFNLAKFASLYKFLMILLRRTNGGKERSMDSFLAGLFGGWVIFGERTTVNEQIVLYSCARCVSALLPRASVPSSYPAKKPIPTDAKSFEIFAALVWGSVMWLFENRRVNLNNGLVNSMDYLYVNAEHWDGLRNLVWHNT